MLVRQCLKSPSHLSDVAKGSCDPCLQFLKLSKKRQLTRKSTHTQRLVRWCAEVRPFLLDLVGGHFIQTSLCQAYLCFNLITAKFHIWIKDNSKCHMHLHATKRKWTQGFWRTGRWTSSLSGWVRQLTYHWGRNAVGPLPGVLRPEWLLVVLQSPEIPLAAFHSTKTTTLTDKFSDHDITSVFVVVCGGGLDHVWIKTSLSECVCLHVHIFALPHMPPYDTDFPQRSCALTGKVKGGWVFFLAVENGGEFYDPCSLSSCKNHTSRFPALQHHRLRSQWKQWSVWRRNKANKEEKPPQILKMFS